jgi:hypothetical protein
MQNNYEEIDNNLCVTTITSDKIAGGNAVSENMMCEKLPHARQPNLPCLMDLFCTRLRL